MENTTGPLIADLDLAHLFEQLRSTRQLLKNLEETEKEILKEIKTAMGAHEEIYNDEGTLMATYKQGNNITRFDAKWLKEQQPDIYDKYLMETPGNRTFLLKTV